MHTTKHIRPCEAGFLGDDDRDLLNISGIVYSNQ